MMLTIPAWAQPPVETGGIQPIVDANIPPSRQWTHHLTFPESIDGVRSMAFAPDRESIYVLYGVKVIDVWAVLVHRWPEVLGGVVVLATVVALLLLRRMMKRAQIVGAPHCRRCGYDVTGQVSRDANGSFEIVAGARCPECGVELSRKKPVRGRPTLVRAWPIAAVWMMLATGYAVMLVGVPRDGRVSTWQDWSSSDLAMLATKRGAFKAHVREGMRIVRVDLARGAVDRVVATRSTPGGQLSITPDGGSVLICDVATRGYLQWETPIRRLDAVSGRDRGTASFVHTASISLMPQNVMVIGFTPDSHQATLSTPTGVVALNLANGSFRKLSARSGGEVVVSGRNYAGRFYAWSAATGEITERSVSDAGPALGSNREIASELYGRYPPVISDNGRRLVFCDRLLRDMDLEAGTPMRTTSVGPVRSLYEFFAVDASGRYAVVNTRDGHMLVRDLDRASWVAQLALPPSVFAGTPQVSPNARWIAGDCLGGNGGTVPFHHDLVLWNFAEVLETSGAAEPSKPGNDPP